MSTAVTVIPVGMQLPAHLMTADAAADIAAANAAAAGGIKAGGFPRISIKGGKFHEVEGGETRTYFHPQQPGQPLLPMMCLEVAILNANPNLTKTYYPGDYKDGDDAEPACSSDNGVTPDSHIASPQSSTCALCVQNQWGSKISKASGKEVKACNDNKRLAVLPAGDLGYKALGLSITPAALGEWGKYVKALSERNIPVNAVVTNLTFDATAAFPKLQFTFNRFLTDVEYVKVKERMVGDDVKTIVAPTRTIAIKPQVIAAPAPAVPPTTTQVQTAAGPATAAAVAPVVVDPYAGQQPHVKMAVEGAGGLDSADGALTYKALTGKDVPVAPPTPVVVDPFAGLQPFVKAAVDGAGGLGSPGGDATYKAMAGKDVPTGNFMQVLPLAPQPTTVTTTTPLPDAPVTVAPVTSGFGATIAAQPAAAAQPPADKPKRAPRAKPPEAPAAAVVDPALSHLSADMLKAVLSVGKDSPAGQAIMAACPAPAAAAQAPAAPPAATPAPAATGFGGPAVATTPAIGPSPEVTAAASSLAARLKARLAAANPPAGATIQ